MQLLWIELRDFRNHTHTRLDVPDGLVTAVGPNGEGKTNLLEGAFYLLSLSSPRSSSDARLVREGAEEAYVRGEVRSALGRALIEIQIPRTGANKVQVNRAPVRRKRDLRKHARGVFFGPGDLRIVEGDPGARREFLDQLVETLWPPRDSLRLGYERVLRQRNRLLKDWRGSGVPPGLETWDEELIAAGTALMAAREEAVELLAPEADREFTTLSGNGLEVRYTPHVHGGPDAASTFRSTLRARLGDELIRRTTLVGPHRDDLHIGVKDLRARGFASHGEAWGAALSLRQGSAAAVTALLGEPPVLVLDDPFSALDPRRRGRVAADLRAGGQVLVSVAEEGHVPPGCAAVWDVLGGSVTQRGGADAV